VKELVLYWLCSLSYPVDREHKGCISHRIHSKCQDTMCGASSQECHSACLWCFWCLATSKQVDNGTDHVSLHQWLHCPGMVSNHWFSHAAILRQIGYYIFFSVYKTTECPGCSHWIVDVDTALACVFCSCWTCFSSYDLFAQAEILNPQLMLFPFLRLLEL